VRLSAKLTLASVMALPLPECLAGRSALPLEPGGRWTPWHAKGRQGQATERTKSAMAQLGHASATVTLDRYGHLFPDELQQLADRLQDAYTDAVTDPARTKPAESMFRQRKGAGR
jgi:hypothetical protein